MLTLPKLMQEVEEALEKGSSDRHAALLSQVTSLLIERGGSLGSGQIGAFDEVLTRLADANGVPARTRLSKRVADLAYAPPRLVRVLAFDEQPAVASPVLERSPCLGDGDLLIVIDRRGLEHLAAIARRRTIPEPVTEALIERGDEAILRATVANPGAAVSNRLCGSLVQKAAEDPMLRRALRARPDLPAGQIARLIDATRAGGGDGPGIVSAPDVVEDLTRRLAAVAAAPDPDADLSGLARKLAAISLLARSRPLTEWNVAEWLRRHDYGSALAAVSTLSRLPARIVAKAYRDDPEGAFMLVMRSLDFSWDTYELSLILHPAGGRPMEALDEAVRRYQRISALEAKVAVKIALGEAGLPVSAPRAAR